MSDRWQEVEQQMLDGWYGYIDMHSLALTDACKRIAELEARLICEECGEPIDGGPGPECMHPAFSIKQRVAEGRAEEREAIIYMLARADWSDRTPDFVQGILAASRLIHRRAQEASDE